MSERLTLFVTILFLLISCQSSPTGTDDPAKIRLTPQEIELIRSSNTFGLELFQRQVASEPDEDIFLSPFSVSMALGMTLNGARSATADSMREVLGFGDLSQEEINTIYRDLKETLSTRDKHVLFEIANSIWTRQGFPVLQSFYEVNREYFEAETRSLDFADPEAPGIINGWIADQTHGKIEKMIDNIDRYVIMYLINAIYFNGIWQTEFDPGDTEEREFTPSTGEAYSIPMMHKSDTMAYFATDRFQAVELPYGSGDFSMVVILPGEGVGLSSLIAELDAYRWDNWIDQFEYRPGNIYLPKFQLKYKAKLNSTLAAMGMGNAFTPGVADFSGISDKTALYISRVLHKTFLEVTEEGTEAAAVTVVEIRYTSVGDEEDEVFVMRIDRPFLMAIRHRGTDTLLFVGKIGHPEWEG